MRGSRGNASGWPGFAIRNFAVLLIAIACAALPGAAQSQEKLQLDPAQTKIHFTLGSTLHTVHGAFTLKSGDVTFDPATGSASGEIIVDAASGNSGNKGRDHKMQTKVLESAKYPEIIFSPEKIHGQLAKSGVSELQVSGEFQIHGASHEITIPVRAERNANHAALSMQFDIPYVQWGMKDPSTFILRADKKVEIEIEAHGELQP